MCEVLQHFNCQDWRELPTEPSAQVAKIVNLAESLDALRSIFVKHDAHSVFGLAVLHRHFDVEDDEVIFESIDRDISVSSPAIATAKMIPHTWRLQRTASGQLRLSPLELMEENATTVQYGSIDFARYQEFFDELAESLVNMGLLDVFGLQLLHRIHIMEPSSDQGIHETTDHKKKTSTMTLLSKKELSRMVDIVPTSWEFSTDPNLATVAGTCNGRWTC